MVVEDPQNEEISGGGKNGGRKGIGCAIRQRGVNRGGGAYTLRNESEEELRGIRRDNGRPGVVAIRTQSRESRNPERGR